MGGSGRVYAAWRAMGAETVHAMATHCLISHIYIVFYLKKFFYYRQQRRAVQGCIRQLSGRVCDQLRLRLSLHCRL